MRGIVSLNFSLNDGIYSGSTISLRLFRKKLSHPYFDFSVICSEERNYNDANILQIIEMRNQKL